MAVSTSISTLANDPWTISTRTGSALAPASAVRWPNGKSVGALRDPVVEAGAFAWSTLGLGGRARSSWWCELVETIELALFRVRTRHDDVAEVVDPRVEARVQRNRRAELLDDRRTVDGRARRKVCPPVDRRVDVPFLGVEADVAAALRDQDLLALPQLLDLRALDRTDAGDPQVHPLDLLGSVVGEVVAVERGVLRVEPGGHLVECGLVEYAVTDGDPDLERLSEVAQVGGAQELVLLLREALLGQRCSGLRAEGVVLDLDADRVECVVQRDVGLHVVVLDVDREQAERRHVAGVRWHQHGRQVEYVDQPAEQQRPGAAEGREREVTDVETTLHGDLAQRVGLVPRRDLEDAGGTGLRGQAELLGQRLHPGLRGVDIEGNLAAEQVRGDAAQVDVGVGDGDVHAPLGVAQRAGIRAGRVRTDLEGALGREPGDRAAAGADGHDVDHRDLARVGADTALGGERGFAVDDDADVGRGAAAVAGEDLVEAGHLRDQRGAERASGRAGQHRRDRLVDDLVGAQHTSVGLHHVERDLAAAVRLESLLDVGDVLAQLRLDRGVDEGGHRPFVLAVLAQHLAGDRHHRVGVLLGQELHAFVPRGPDWRRRAGSTPRGCRCPGP